MSFDLDDPLAGILSDGSDDSFFDDDILGKKKPAKKSDTPIAEKKNALFDLSDTVKPNSSASVEKNKDFISGHPDTKKTFILEDSKNNILNTASPTALRRSLSKEKVQITEPLKKVNEKGDFSKSPAKSRVGNSSDTLDILGDLLPDTKRDNSKLKGKSSQSLLDDILGGPSTKPAPAKSTSATFNHDFDINNILGKTESKPVAVAPKTTPLKKVEIPKVEIQKKNKPNDDWLGIFQDKNEDKTEEEAEMPAWLLGTEVKKKNEMKKIEITKQEAPDIQEKTINVKDDEKITHNNVVQDTSIVTPTLQGVNTDVASEGAALYFQQQESQLMVALQLKAQEEKLAAIQMRQKEAQRVQRESNNAQRSQLDAMLKRQAEQRQQMQAVIAAHQERITQRIKALLDTSTNVEGDSFEATEDINPMDTTAGKKDSPYLREKKQLLQLVQSLQENHDKEIDLMETSYRRQLAFQEISLSQAEDRMKEESEKLVKFYSEKIVWLEEHHQLFKKMAEENLISMTERHKNENELLRQQHLENVKILQEHHSALMENVKNAVKQEQILIKDTGGFSMELNELIAGVKENKSQCQSLVDKVQALTDTHQTINERSILARETQIHDMIKQLKKERENFDIEKNENRDLIKMLETRLKQMTNMIEEETAALKQKKMEFEFETATFKKQTEFAKNTLKRQDEEMKILKEDIQKEYQDRVAIFNEERSKIVRESATVAKEKVAIQNIKQELEKIKAELQAQLEEVNEEKSRINVEKQQMHIEEQRILAKSRDLDLLAKTAIDKQSQADKKYSEAEFLQRKYEERIRRIQEHVVSLNAREKQIAKEKVALSRERLTIHNEKKEMASKMQCSLCRPQKDQTLYENVYNPEMYVNHTVSRDYENSNMATAMNAIEQEMAILMSKNLNLKHYIPRRENVNHFEDVTRHIVSSNPGDALETVEGMQLDSETFKDFMDPKFMMLRLDVQSVINNIDQAKKKENDDEKDLASNIEMKTAFN